MSFKIIFLLWISMSYWCTGCGGSSQVNSQSKVNSQSQVNSQSKVNSQSQVNSQSKSKFKRFKKSDVKLTSDYHSLNPLKKKIKISKITILGFALKNNTPSEISTEELNKLSAFVKQGLARLPIDHFMVFGQERIKLSNQNHASNHCENCKPEINEKIDTDYMLFGEVTSNETINVTLKLYHNRSNLLKASDQISMPKEQLDQLKGPLQGITVNLFSKIIPKITPQMMVYAQRLSNGFFFDKVALYDLWLPNNMRPDITPLKIEIMDMPITTTKEIEHIHFDNMDPKLKSLYEQAIKIEKNLILRASEKKNIWDDLATSAQESEIGKFAKDRSLIWETVIDYEKYLAVVRFDQSDAPIQQKIERWEVLIKNTNLYETQARQRIIELQNLLGKHQQRENLLNEFHHDLLAFYRLRTKKIDQAWDRLSKILSSKKLSISDKQNWISAFVEAYGIHETLNPYVEEIDVEYFSNLTWDENILVAQNVEEMKLFRDLFLIFPNDFWTDSDFWFLNVFPKKLLRKYIGMKMLPLVNGSFMMGSNGENEFEKPMHRVAIKGFYMSKTEVTIGQYRKCIQAGVCTPPNCHWTKEEGTQEDMPVRCITWHQARTFAKWVGGDLPTEAQWEYAAKSAGRDIKYPWGYPEASCSHAVMYDEDYGCGQNTMWPVCSKPLGNSIQGICDLSGNVFEWVLDEWHDSYVGAPNDGEAVCKKGDCQEVDLIDRVIRGGSWYHTGEDLRSTAREHCAANRYVLRNEFIGIRVVTRDNEI